MKDNFESEKSISAFNKFPYAVIALPLIFQQLFSQLMGKIIVSGRGGLSRGRNMERRGILLKPIELRKQCESRRVHFL